VAFVDGTIDALRVMRTPAFSGTAISVVSHPTISYTQSDTAAGIDKSHEKPMASAKNAKVPRPPNAFILYRQRHHPQIKAAYPDFHNNDICKFTNPNHSNNQLTPAAIMLGKQWKDEPEEVKAQYRAQAEEVKKKHAEKHPNYQYTPRKPSEKKRRASSRQYKPTKVNAVVQSPASGTLIGSNISTPVMPIGFQPNNLSQPGNVNGMNGMNNVVLGPGDMVDEQFNFNAHAYNALVQHTNTNGDQFVMYQDMNNAGAATGHQSQNVPEPFEFSDFMTDFY